jgi:uncharacterized protein
VDDLEATEGDGTVSFRVRVTPRASRDGVLGLHDGALEVALTAPPVSGAANEALVRLLAKGLGVSRRDVEVVRGHSSRDKRVRVRGIGAAELRALARG